MSQNGQIHFKNLAANAETIAIHTFPNISRSKVNQMEFGKLTEYNMRNKWYVYTFS